MPAVDDSPSAALLIEQAQLQARPNPREAARLLTEALDGGPLRLVSAGGNGDRFITVFARVRELLLGEAAVRDAFRREHVSGSVEALAAGDEPAVALLRPDTDAGVEAALRQAQAALAAGRCAEALGWLRRCQGSDLLVDRRAAFHASMWRDARACADRAPASVGPAPGGTLTATPGSDWRETWSVPLDGSPTIGAAIGAEVRSDTEVGLPAVPLSFAALDSQGVVVDDGRNVRSLDRLTGRTGWAMPVSGVQRAFDAFPSPVGSAIRPVTLWGDLALATGSGPGRSGMRVVAIGRPGGELRWQSSLVEPDRRDQGGAASGLPVTVDGLLVSGFRRVSSRLETVSSLVALDLDRPRLPAWTTLLASTGGARGGGARAPDMPVSHAGSVFVATATGAVAAIEPLDGAPRWVVRFPVPVREAGGAANAFALAGPAVVGDAVFVLLPDRSRVVVLDAETGTERSSHPTGIDTAYGSPEYLVGDPGSATVLAVGDRVSCIPAATPAIAAWSVSVTDQPLRRRPIGRVAFVRTADAARPLVAWPDAEDLTFLDGASGREVARLSGAGASNVLALGNHVVAVSSTRVSSWMPAADAERAARDALASLPGVEGVLPLLQLARQSRNAALAEVAAPEAARRAAGVDADDPVLLDLAGVLERLERMDLQGAAGPSIDAALDAVVDRAGQPLRGALLRSDRALRRGQPLRAARLATEAALVAPESAMLRDGAGASSAVAACQRRVRAAVSESPEAVQGVMDAVAAGLAVARGNPAAEARARTIGTVLAGGTKEGARWLGPSAVPAPQVLPLGRAAAGLGTDPAAIARALSIPGSSTSRLLDVRPVDPPTLAGSPERMVEFIGRLPRLASGIRHPSGGLLTFAGGELVLRRGRDFGVEWRIPVGMEGGTLIATDGSFVVVEDAAGLPGAVASVTADGRLSWRIDAPPPSEEAADLPLFDRGEANRGSDSWVGATGTSIVRFHADGAIQAWSRTDGSPSWERGIGDGPLLATASDHQFVAVVRQSEDPVQGIRVEVLSADDGAMLLQRSLPDASEVRWMRVVDGSLMILGTDAGIQCHSMIEPWLPGPRWTVDAADAGSTVRSWSAGRWIVALTQYDDLLAVDAWTGEMAMGRFALSASTVPGLDGPPLDVLAGRDAIVVLRQSGADIFDSEGRPIGATAAVLGRSCLAAAVALDRVALLEGDPEGRADVVPLRFTSELSVVEVLQGGRQQLPPLTVRTMGRGLDRLAITDGSVVAGNGTVIRAISFAPRRVP